MSNVQIGWKVDVNACISCRACEMACKVEYDLKAGQGRRRRVIEKTLDESGKIRTFFISLACNHCENPACIAACPKAVKLPADWATNPTSKASYLSDPNLTSSPLYKDLDGTYSGGVKGVVRVNPDTCIGCRRCEWACPYGAPQYNPESGKIHKCEMCWQRIANDNLHPSRRVGACVATCLGQSIKQDWVDTDPTVSYSHTRKDTDDAGSGGLLGGNATSGSQTYPAGQSDFASPGVVADSPGKGRGTLYIADASLTKPALKVRSRVYVTRDGMGVE